MEIKKLQDILLFSPYRTRLDVQVRLIGNGKMSTIFNGIVTCIRSNFYDRVKERPLYSAALILYKFCCLIA